jgi:hypothetical protein
MGNLPEEDREALDADALGDEPRRLALMVALFFADRREEAGADETTESRASSIAKIGNSRIEYWVECLGRIRPLPLGFPLGFPLGVN